MSNDDIAAAVLECVGGFSNVAGNSLCATRLRITLKNPSLINRNALHSINGVLGLADRGTRGIEIVFGPNLVRGVYRSFERLTGLTREPDSAADMTPIRPSGNFQVKITPEMPGAPQVRGEVTRAATPDPPAIAPLIDDETTALLERLDGGPLATAEDEGQEAPSECPRPHLLVLNGPNINMLGLDDDSRYGIDDFSALLTLCHHSAKAAGFASCECYQSNHEGDLIDALQDAYGSVDGVIINPGTLASTSIALSETLETVQIPAVEVLLEAPDADTGAPDPSHVGKACLATVAGHGLDGYRMGIELLAKHLNL